MNPTTRLVALTFAVVAVATPAPAFSPDVLRSVVSVLPEAPPRAGQRTSRLEEPEGSAVAVLPGGYLVTNVHVLGHAERVKVRLEDGRVLPAEIVGRDALTDIALIKVGVDVPALPAGPEPALGVRVCAVGNPFGLGLSVTCGVVSAVRRSGTGFNPVEDFIQTDASINPGGSGGALVDADNRLVGLVSAIYTKRNDADIGVNFAASAALVMRVVQDLYDFGHVVHGRSGLRLEDLAIEERATLVGARVKAAEGAAAEAGLRPGDIVTAVLGRPVRRASDAGAAFYLGRPGDSVEVAYRRSDETATVRLIMGR